MTVGSLYPAADKIMYRIISFKDEYRDDVIFCYLLAKDALGFSIKIRDDLFNIKKNYLTKTICFG